MLSYKSDLKLIVIVNNHYFVNEIYDRFIYEFIYNESKRCKNC